MLYHKFNTKLVSDWRIILIIEQAQKDLEKIESSSVFVFLDHVLGIKWEKGQADGSGY